MASPLQVKMQRLQKVKISKWDAFKENQTKIIFRKSGNTRANSLKSIMKNNKDISYGYKFIDGNVGTSEEGIITLPLYMIAFFDKVSE